MNDQKKAKTSKWIFFSHLVLGIVIGNLVGLSSDNLSKIFLNLLLASGGVTSIVMIMNQESLQQKMNSILIIFLSLGCLIGVYTGILITEFRLLSPEKNYNIDKVKERKYLRNSNITEITLIDQKYRNGEISLEEAYELIQSSSEDN